MVLSLYCGIFLRTDISGIRLLAVVSAKGYMTFQNIILFFMIILRYLENFQTDMPYVLRSIQVYPFRSLEGNGRG